MRFLFTTFEGGGHVPPAIVVARQLQARGHEVLFVSDEANRAQAAAAGLSFQTWRTAPNRARLGDAEDPLNEWRKRWPPAVVRAICEAVITGPADRYATDTRALLQEHRPDVLVSNELLFGALLGAEAEGVPTALLTANVWCFPTRTDLPPFGPGFAPGDSAYHRQRDEGSRRWISRMYDAGLADLNAARAQNGLPPLAATLRQLDAASLVLLGVSAAFDYGREAPEPFVYAGPLGEAPAWANEGSSGHELLDPERPNVLVSFSTTYQGQERAIARCVRALSGLPVNGIVTLGPALRLEATPSAPNVKVVASAPHDVLVPRCAAVICHGGHGTVLRPLIHGVPVICLPMGRDHPENAQRLVALGAGVRLSRDAGVGRIRAAVRKVLAEPRFGGAARMAGLAIHREADGGVKASEALEALAQRSRIS